MLERMLRVGVLLRCSMCVPVADGYDNAYRKRPSISSVSTLYDLYYSVKNKCGQKSANPAKLVCLYITASMATVN
jgi:hypothetical protein